jgi:hypothetical protein
MYLLQAAYFQVVRVLVHRYSLATEDAFPFGGC